MPPGGRPQKQPTLLCFSVCHAADANLGVDTFARCDFAPSFCIFEKGGVLFSHSAFWSNNHVGIHVVPDLTAEEVSRVVSVDHVMCHASFSELDVDTLVQCKSC